MSDSNSDFRSFADVDQPVRSGRRRFLAAASGMSLAAMTTATDRLAVAAEGRVAEGQGVMLRPAGRQDLFRVRIELDVEGNVNVPTNALVSRKSAVTLPITSESVFDYEERLRRSPSAGVNGAGANGAAQSKASVGVAERYYHQAESKSELNRRAVNSTLRDEVRQCVVRTQGMPELIYAVDDYFLSDELELLRMPASSLGIDELLPTVAVTVGQTYEPTRETMRSVLSLSSVEASDVRAEVVEITSTSAKIQFRGKVDGSIDGVPTVVRTVGKLTFDRTIGASTWLAMAVHETREIGKAKPGFDVSATIKLLRKPLARPARLPAKPRAIDFNSPAPADRLYVDFHSDELGFAALMDRRWGLISDVPGAAMMRMIDADRSIAQCDFRPLASLPSGTQWTLAAFEQDVKKTLGEQLSELISADERATDVGTRVMRVTAAGAVEGVPIQWVLLHISDDSGRRLLATFTMEAKNNETFAGSDLQLASSLRLTDRKRSGRPPTGESSTPQAATPATKSTRIARSKSNDPATSEVQSASDLR